MNRRFVTVEVSDPALEVDGLRHVTVQSPALGRRVDCTLWAPIDAGGPLPLVTLLHGVYGSHWAWAHLGAAHRTAKRLIDEESIPPLALAMPSDGLWGHGSGYVLGPGGDSPAWIVDEVPALAAELIPDVEPTSPLALAGLSMGGLGALLLGVRSAPRYRAVAGLSSITEFREMTLFVGDLSGYGVDSDDHSVATTVLTHRGPLPDLYLCCGTDDLLIEHNRALHERLVVGGIEHEWVEGPGGHEWAYWRSQLPDVLRFIGRALTNRPLRARTQTTPATGPACPARPAVDS